MRSLNVFLMHKEKNEIFGVCARHNYNEIEDVITFFRELKDYCEKKNLEFI